MDDHQAPWPGRSSACTHPSAFALWRSPSFLTARVASVCAYPTGFKALAATLATQARGLSGALQRSSTKTISAEDEVRTIRWPV